MPSMETEAQHSVEGPLPIPYTAEEVGRTFAELLDTFDFAYELRELGVGSCNVFKRGKAKRHLTALCIALWHIALEKSFPNDAKAFFLHFRQTYPLLTGEKRGAKKLREILDRYDAILCEKKDGDFTRAAEELLDAFTPTVADNAKLQLKLSLHIRTIYDLIFTKLI
ncbi:MAG: hypothetical protein DELT_01120 [Desulfovibrio sp.]